MKKLFNYIFIILVTGCSIFENDSLTEQKLLLSVSDVGEGRICSNGGIRIASGIDLSRNGKLEEGEITSTKIICKEVDGSTGVVGLIKTVLLDTSSSCKQGGLEVFVGFDTNKNKTLDYSEQRFYYTICNSEAGLHILFMIIKIPYVISSFEGTVLSKGEGVSHFNIDDYPGLNFIYYGIGGQGIGYKDHWKIDLFNKTDSAIIEGSSIDYETGDVFGVVSDNLVEAFPQREIELVVRVRAVEPGIHFDLVEYCGLGLRPTGFN